MQHCQSFMFDFLLTQPCKSWLILSIVGSSLGGNGGSGHRPSGQLCICMKTGRQRLGLQNPVVTTCKCWSVEGTTGAPFVLGQPLWLVLQLDSSSALGGERASIGVAALAIISHLLDGGGQCPALATAGLQCPWSSEGIHMHTPGFHLVGVVAEYFVLTHTSVDTQIAAL